MSVAITAALVVLGYYEMPEEDQPDENIWHHPQRLEEWFAAVKQRRENGMEPIDQGEDTDMESNALVREMMEG